MFSLTIFTSEKYLDFPPGSNPHVEQVLSASMVIGERSHKRSIRRASQRVENANWDVTASVDCMTGAK